MSANKKFNTLTLKSKIDLIMCYEKQKVSVKLLAEKYKCGKTQVYDTLKNKDKIKSDWLEGKHSIDTKRKSRKTGNEETNKILYQWFLDARNRNLPISGPILQEQAKIIARRLGKEDFKASNGWLESFRSRHEITLKQVCGEANDVNLDDWKVKLKYLIKDYKPENVGNCDETGLFFKALPSKTLTLKNGKCVGGKQPKERLTVLLCGFADGTLEKPLVIGKSLKPRCFKNLNEAELPVTWRANKKAWMTSEIMEEWLKALNRKMKIEERKILLFLDNAACHPKNAGHLSNIKLAFFPPNTTSLAQPMDQGVIQNMKLHYRKLMLQSLSVNMASCNSVTELSKKISVLDAIRWISSATQNIGKDCVKNCFKHANFDFQKGEKVTVKVEECERIINDTTEPYMLDTIQIIMDELGENFVTPENYVEIDKTVPTEGGYQDIDDLIASSETNLENKDEEEGQGLGIDVDENEKINNFTEAFKKLTSLELFAENINCSEMTEKLLHLRTAMEKNAPLIQIKTEKITDIWDINMG